MAFSLDIILSAGTILAVFAGFSAALSGQNGCAEVRDAYQEKGFSTNEVPDFAVSGDHLRICTQSFTCCTADMEEKLSQTGSAEFEDLIYEKSSTSRDYFIRRADRFDDFFKDLIDKGRTELNLMFLDTYGPLYQQNSELFDELFENFRRYYHGSSLDLDDVMDNFFTELLQRMFKLLNSNYEYSEDFLECLAEHGEELQPFGDVPTKLTLHVKRALIVARTFVQGLSVGRDVLTQVLKVTPTPECQKSLMRMSYCPHCRGLPTTKPCYNMCVNTMKGCLAEQAELEAAWNNYIDAMLLLVDRLEGPVNIESVMDSIDIRISEAIMNMQENALTVTDKVLMGCGKSGLKSRTKRDVSGEEAEAAAEEGARIEGAAAERTEAGERAAPVERPAPDDENPLPAGEGPAAAGQRGSEGAREAGSRGRGNSKRQRQGQGQGQGSWNFRRGGGSGGEQPHQTMASSPTVTMDKLVKDVRGNIDNTKGFWTMLPYMICEEVAADVTVVDLCWNGHSKGSYTHSLVGNGIANQVDNPEVAMQTTQPNFLINKHINSLRTITSRLNGAANGEDVDFMDLEDYQSGSGSGSGSGDGEDGNELGGPDDNGVGFTVVEDPVYRPTRKPQNAATSLYASYATRWLACVCATVFTLSILW